MNENLSDSDEDDVDDEDELYSDLDDEGAQAKGPNSQVFIF